MIQTHNAEWISTTAIGDVSVILVLGVLFSLLARRFRQPVVIGEIAAGIALGPSLLGLLPGDLPDRIFPPEVRPTLNVVAQVGLLLFMFIIGWEFDTATMNGSKRSTFLIWIGSCAVALGLGMALAAALYSSHDSVNGHHIRLLDFSLYIGVAMSITAFPVLARIIADHRMQTSRIGTLALSLAAADDVLAWCMLAVVVALATTSGAAGFLAVLCWSAVYVTGMLLVVRPALARLFASLPKGSAPYVAMGCAAGVYLSSYTTSKIGIHAIFGAFFFGMVMPRRGVDKVLAKAIHDPLKHASNLMLPVFFVVTGLSVDLTTIDGKGLLEMLAIITVACLGKLGGVVFPSRLAGMSWRDSTSLGLLMNTRGLTELIILNVGLGLGLLSVELFTSMVMMALVTTAMAAPLLTLTLNRQAAAEPAVEPQYEEAGTAQDRPDSPERRMAA